MKYFLVFAVVWLAIWLWRHKRETEVRAAQFAQRQAPRMQAQQIMRECEFCGIHVPEADAVKGDSNDVYCSIQHRKMGV